MTVENFAYWLQGFMELAQPTELTPLQIQMILNHMLIVQPLQDSGLVFSVEVVFGVNFLNPQQKVHMINLLLGTYLDKVTPTPEVSRTFPFTTAAPC